MLYKKNKIFFIATMLATPWLLPIIILAVQNFSSGHKANFSSQHPQKSIIRIYDGNDLVKSNIFSYYDLLNIDSKKAPWIKNSKWKMTFLQNPEEIQEIVKKYLYFQEQNFVNNLNDKTTKNLVTFFANQYNNKKNEFSFKELKIELELFSIGFPSLFSNNFLIIEDFDDYLNFFKEFEDKQEFDRKNLNKDFFDNNLFLVYVKEDESNVAPIFNKTSLETNLSPIDLITYKNQNLIISIDQKFSNYLKENSSSTSRTRKRFQIFYKSIPKNSYNKSYPLSSIKITDIEDLVLYNSLDKTSAEFSNFLDFINKKSTILSRKNLKKNRFYASQIDKNIANLSENKIFSNFSEVKDLINNKNLLKNEHWKSAFHLSNLFIPTKTQDKTYKFNSFILQKQQLKEIFKDEIIYWEFDKNSKKVLIYTLNYKDIFHQIAKQPENFNFDNLLQFEKIDIGDIDVQEIEIKKLNSIEDFNNLYNKTMG
ncbi:Uncharacterised protein [Mesomycoplasma dispar]|uniref:Uncharacterized protein n=1 Tax=Mesomycoplasma dispar TaxID=86660 RepID=A0AAJ5TCP0_9BACT|nr:hypothetical protein [Mesomycoplasma dispar]AJR12284.1 hypothetical protein MDIS_02640 [Mesomycoplasma dispar]VEU62027.1 Uncharacterised protein [Mesomycoplasma dispar]